MARTYRKPGIVSADMRIAELEIDKEERIGQGGFLTIRRLHVRNRREDGSRSRQYLCDLIERPLGLDAVVVAIFTRARGRIEVLLRDALRPALVLGRSGSSPTPVSETRDRLRFPELVAGIIEAEDRGEDGVRHRAALEVAEEAGYQVRAADVLLLGSGTFPVPGMIAERWWLTAVEVATPDHQPPAEGDGSPMEEGAETRWLALDDAIVACVAGTIEDTKTELTLRRLRDHLS
jgi:ADP-ribose pyrophosphatase